MAVVVYGIPTCGTVKKARAWLVEQGIEHAFVDFRQRPPSRAQVERWVRAFGFGPMRNTSGGSYRALGAEKEGWGEADWVEAFAADPMLIRRPVVERDGEPEMVGFRPETAASIGR